MIKIFSSIIQAAFFICWHKYFDIVLLAREANINTQPVFSNLTDVYSFNSEEEDK